MPTYVEVFYQIDLLQQRDRPKAGQTPDDPKSLARLGEIKFDEGDLQQAIDLFRRSFDLAPNDHTRGLLVSSLLEGLRRDFAGSRGKAGRVGKTDRPAVRSQPLFAAGRRRAEAVGRIAGRLRCLHLAVERTERSGRHVAPATSLEPAGEGLRGPPAALDSIGTGRFAGARRAGRRRAARPARGGTATVGDRCRFDRGAASSFWKSSARIRWPPRRASVWSAQLTGAVRSSSASCCCGGWRSRPTRAQARAAVARLADVVRRSPPARSVGFLLSAIAGSMWADIPVPGRQDRRRVDRRSAGRRPRAQAAGRLDRLAAGSGGGEGRGQPNARKQPPPALVRFEHSMATWRRSLPT